MHATPKMHRNCGLDPKGCLLQRGVEQRVAEALGHLNCCVGPFLCEQEATAWVVVDDSINTARWVKEGVTQTDDKTQRSEEKKAYG